MNAVRFRGLHACAAMLLLAPAVAAATDLRWSVRLSGEAREFIEVLIDTRSIESNAVIDSATFTAHIHHPPDAIDAASLSFLDNRLRALTSGHVYRRSFRHGFLQASNVTSEGLQIQVRAEGGKADGFEAPPAPEVDETQVIPSDIPAPDVDIEPPPADAPPPTSTRFLKDRRAFQKAKRKFIQAQQQVSPAGPQPLAAKAAAVQGRAPRLVYSTVSAPADPVVQRCMAYADAAITIYAMNRQKGCVLSNNRWNPSYARHFDWCLQASDKGLANEAAARERELRDCIPEERKQ